MSEIKDIMLLLGRRMIEGQVKGSHLGQILMYLQQKHTESLKSTLSKLALVCGMSKRNVRENYIEGIEEFGIIKTTVIGNEVIWTWIGIRAFGELNEPFMNHVKREQKKEKEKEKEEKEKKRKEKKEKGDKNK